MVFVRTTSGGFYANPGTTGSVIVVVADDEVPRTRWIAPIGVSRRVIVSAGTGMMAMMSAVLLPVVMNVVAVPVVFRPVVMMVAGFMPLVFLVTRMVRVTGSMSIPPVIIGMGRNGESKARDRHNQYTKHGFQ